MAGRGNPAWKAGVSGNPGGRTKLPEWFKDKGPKALRHMLRVASGEVVDDKVSRYEACERVAHMIYGKPAQALEHSGSLEVMTEEETKKIKSSVKGFLEKNGLRVVNE